MKSLLTLRILLSIALMASVAFIVSCDGDDDNGPKELFPKLDGFYVYGTNTIAESATEPMAKMTLAPLDATKAPGIATKDGVFSKIMYIGANSTIKFAKVENEVATTFGAVDGGIVANGEDLDFVEISGSVIHGELVESEEEIKITNEGLYNVFVESNSGTFVIAPVEANVIGDATPEGWTNGTMITQKSASKDSTVFESTIVMKGAAGYKYRLHDGWGLYLEADEITSQTSLGVDDYGLAWDTGKNEPLIFTEKNMPNKEGGRTIMKLKFTAATNEWKETKETTYTGVSVGILGDAAGNWDTAFGLKEPTKSGKVYTWTWNDTNLNENGQFVILENGTWGGLAVVFPSVANAGDAFTSNKIIKAADSDNFHVVTGGVYDIKLEVNAATNARTLTISSN
jgi:hypothetical protein